LETLLKVPYNRFKRIIISYYKILEEDIKTSSIPITGIRLYDGSSLKEMTHKRTHVRRESIVSRAESN